jgi:hypothetical protein
MIQYALKCKDGHSFDSWFQSADAFEKLHRAGLIECAVCGDGTVSKAVMSPRVNSAVANVQKPERALSEPASPAQQALAELRKTIEKNADYVGNRFVDEARAIHEGTAPERAIYGEARLEDAKKLMDEGVPVAPLPYSPNRKVN